MADRTYECPSPGECNFSTSEIGELTEHVNTEHSGEYQKEDWPDTLAGCTSRALDDEESEDDE